MFIFLLSEVRYKYPFTLHTYCLMNNHFHLLIESKEITPSRIMQIIQQRYSRYFNRTDQQEGHVFQSRFFASKIHDNDHLLNVSRYIHLVETATIFSCYTQNPREMYRKYVEK